MSRNDNSTLGGKMLEKILESISGRSRTLAEQAETIERLESQIKESNKEREAALADARKLERLAKQSGDRLRERVQKLTAENKELASSNKKLELDCKRALADKEAELTAAVKESESLRGELAAVSKERDVQDAMLDEAVQALQDIGESLGVDVREKSPDDKGE